MRLILLAPALFFAACASPGENGRGIPPVPPESYAAEDGPTGFDAQAWLAEVREIGQYPDKGTPEAAREMELASELDAEVDWTRACDTYYDIVSGETVYDPVESEYLDGVRGRMDVAPISETEAVVSMTCNYGAYQGTYVFVHIDGDRATRLRAPALSEDSQPLNVAEQTAFAEPFWDDLASSRTFQTFSKSRGPGDCGEWVEYALDGDETLTIRQIRMRDCAADLPDPLPPPSEWPVVYTAE